MENSAREQVLEAATKFFAENGYARVSLQELATTTGVNISEVSELFSTVEMLYETVLENQFSLYATRMDSVFGGSVGPTEKVGLFAQAMCDVHKQVPYFFPLFYRELLNPSPFFESIVQKNIRHVAYLSDNNIVRGIQKDQFKRGVNPANATMFLAGMFHYYFLASRLAGGVLVETANDEEYFSQAVKIYLSGLSTEK